MTRRVKVPSAASVICATSSTRLPPITRSTICLSRSGSSDRRMGKIVHGQGRPPRIIARPGPQGAGKDRRFEARRPFFSQWPSLAFVEPSKDVTIPVDARKRKPASGEPEGRTRWHRRE